MVKDPFRKEFASDMRQPVEDLVRMYQENLFRAAFSVCRNQQDAEDVVQETFIRYMRSDRDFESEEHIKAWLLRTAINQAKNVVRSFWHRNRSGTDEFLEQTAFAKPEDRDLVQAVLALPEKYRVVLHLFYYEDESVSDIASLLKISESAVKNRLLRGRKMLKNMLKGG